MAVLEQPKAKVARIKRNPQPMSLDEFFDATSKRYPKIIARLAE